MIRLALVFVVLSSLANAQSAFSAEMALRTLYGNYDPQTKTAIWKDFSFPQDGKPWEQNKFICEADAEPLRVRVLLDKATQENGTTKHYFVTWASPQSWGEFSGRICQVAIGASVFAWKDAKWDLESSNRYLTSAGSYGNSPNTVTLVNIGKQKHGIVMETFDMTQGYHDAGAKLIAPAGADFNELWFENIYADNSGRCSDQERCYKTVVKYGFVQNADSEYSDIRVVSHGTGPNANGKVVATNWTNLFRYHEGKYQLLQTTMLPKNKARSGRKANPKH